LKKEKIDDFDFNKFTFINVGRLTYQKGQDRLLKGFDIFHQNFPDTQLVIL
jgi:glycosyltransferase involved in cell wall biosynthesis